MRPTALHRTGWGGVSLTETPQDRDPLDRDPQDRDPPGQRPRTRRNVGPSSQIGSDIIQRPPSLWTDRHL